MLPGAPAPVQSARGGFLVGRLVRITQASATTPTSGSTPWEIVVVDGCAGKRPGDVTLGQLLQELDVAAPYELVEVCDRWLRKSVDACACTLLLVDHSQSSLEPVPVPGTGNGSTGRPHEVTTGPAGAAYREQRVVEEVRDMSGSTAGVVVYLPVTIRSQRIGVIMVELPGPPPVEVREVLADVARVLAHVLAGANRFTDRFEVLRRRRDLGLAAEIQWELLPVLANELPAFSIAGALEPTYDIGGDTFDYAVSASRLTVSITDAVGHGLRAAMLGSLAVTAMRNARRCGERMVQQASAANGHLAEQFPGSSYVTGLLLELDLPAGTGGIINAGHPPPLLLREGSVRHLPLSPDLPLGLYGDTVHRRQELGLRPGDRLLLITDGVSEAHVTGRHPFGLERVAELLTTHAHLPPVEFVRYLTQAVMTYCSGQLTDDATAVCLDWH